MKILEKSNKISKRSSLLFNKGSQCKVSVHEHPMTYMSSNTWICDGGKLPGGCESDEEHFTYEWRFSI